MAHILLITVAYLVLVAAFLSGLLRVFGASFKITDALLAALLASLISLIPTVGPAISVLGIALVVYWRCTEISLVLVLVASGVSRLAAGILVAKLLMN